MGAAIYICEAHDGCIVSWTHDGFLNKCPMCTAKDQIEELKQVIDGAVELLPEAPTLAKINLQNMTTISGGTEVNS